MEINTREHDHDPALSFRQWILACLVALVMAFSGCAQPPDQTDADDTANGRHTYKEIKPDVVPVPEGVIKALPGLLNDNLYLYKEIAPSLNLVAYVPQYSPAGAIEMCAKAFVVLADDPNPQLTDDIDFWIIQIQPAPGSADVPVQPGDPANKHDSRLVVWGVRPVEVEAYKKTGDLAKFLTTSEYLLVDDKIIPAGDARINPFPELKPAPLPGNTAAPTPPTDGGEPAPEPEDGNTA